MGYNPDYAAEMFDQPPFDADEDDDDVLDFADSDIG